MLMLESGGERWCVDSHEAVICDSALESDLSEFRASCVSVTNKNNAGWDEDACPSRDCPETQEDGTGFGPHEDGNSILPNIVDRLGNYTAASVTTYRAYSFDNMLGTRLIDFSQGQTLCQAAGKTVIPYSVWTDLVASGPDRTGPWSWEISEAADSVPHFRKTQAYTPPDSIPTDLMAFSTDKSVGTGIRCAKLLPP
jgi:hypothetical protein